MKQPNRVKGAMREGRKAYGYNLTFPSPWVIDILAPLDFDFVWLDGEHGPFNLDQVEDLCRAAEAAGVTPIARVPDINPSTVLRFLDRGIQGIMGPHIATRAEAEQLAKACLFGPEGERSYGANRGTDYDFSHPAPQGWPDRTDYYRQCNENMLVGALLEDAQAEDDIEEILKVDGIDYFSIGFNDFAQSIGMPGKGSSPEAEKRMDALYQRIRAGGGRVASDIMEQVWVHHMLVESAQSFLKGKK